MEGIKGPRSFGFRENPHIEELSLTIFCYANRMVQTRSEEEIRTMIAQEVSRTLLEELPTLLENLKGDIITEIDTRVAAAIAANSTPTPPGSGPREVGFKDFSACRPPTFHGGKDPVASLRWIADIESAFYMSYVEGWGT